RRSGRPAGASRRSRCSGRTAASPPCRTARQSGPVLKAARSAPFSRKVSVCKCAGRKFHLLARRQTSERLFGRGFPSRPNPRRHAMKFRSLILVSALLALCAPAARADDKKDIQALYARLQQAMMKKDVKGLMALGTSDMTMKMPSGQTLNAQQIEQQM